MLLQMFELDQFDFNFYSLRRGGATYDFASHGSMERTLLKGRWESTRSARVYVNEARAAAVYTSLSQAMIDSLREAVILGMRKLAEKA